MEFVKILRLKEVTGIFYSEAPTFWLGTNILIQ